MTARPTPVSNDVWGAQLNAWLDETFATKAGTTHAHAGPTSVRYVTTAGNDADDGLSWGTAKATLQAAHDALPAAGGVVMLSGQTFTITTRVNVSKPVIWQGMGRDVTVLSGGVNSDYQFLRTGTTDLAGVEFRDLTIDLGAGTSRSGIRVEWVSRFAVRRCRIRNVTAWGLVVGVMLGTDATIRNSDVTIEDCDFDTISGTMEHLLLFNSRDVVVRDCRFNGIGSTAYGIGLYQNVDGVVLDNLHFTGAGTGTYYSLSTNNITITNSRYLCGRGVQGANQSDNGVFGSSYVRGMTVRDSLFSTTGASFGLQLGAVQDAVVAGCTFYRCQEIGLLITSGNAPVATVPRNIAVIGCRFRETNQSGVTASIHPAVRVATAANAPELGLVIVACSFDDQQGTTTQIYPVSFGGAFAYNKVRIVGNRMRVGAGGASVLLTDGATLGAAVTIGENLDYTATGGAAETGTEVITLAASDETTDLTTGTKVTFRTPFALALSSVRASLTTASSSGVVTVDINEGGTSILSTKLTIDATEKTSTTAAVAAVISDATLADDAEITVDIDTAGTGAKGLKVLLIGTRA